MLIDSREFREKQRVRRDLAHLHAIHQALGAPQVAFMVEQYLVRVGPHVDDFLLGPKD